MSLEEFQNQRTEKKKKGEKASQKTERKKQKKKTAKDGPSANVAASATSNERQQESNNAGPSVNTATSSTTRPRSTKEKHGGKNEIEERAQAEGVGLSKTKKKLITKARNRGDEAEVERIFLKAKQAEKQQALTALRKYQKIPGPDRTAHQNLYRDRRASVRAAFNEINPPDGDDG